MVNIKTTGVTQKDLLGETLLSKNKKLPGTQQATRLRTNQQIY